MPSATGLVRRAILQSLPRTYITPELATDIATDIATEITAELGCSPRIQDLAEVPPHDLVGASRTVTARLPNRAYRWGAIAQTPTPFSPVVDGEILLETSWAGRRRGPRCRAVGSRYGQSAQLFASRIMSQVR